MRNCSTRPSPSHYRIAVQFFYCLPLSSVRLHSLLGCDRHTHMHARIITGNTSAQRKAVMQLFDVSSFLPLSKAFAPAAKAVKPYKKLWQTNFRNFFKRVFNVHLHFQSGFIHVFWGRGQFQAQHPFYFSYFTTLDVVDFDMHVHLVSVQQRQKNVEEHSSSVRMIGGLYQFGFTRRTNITNIRTQHHHMCLCLQSSTRLSLAGLVLQNAGWIFAPGTCGPCPSRRYNRRLLQISCECGTNLSGSKWTLLW